LLSEQELKGWLHRDLKQLDKLLLILATFDGPAGLGSIKDRAASAGLKIGSRWNPSSTLGRSKGLAIKVPNGWELTESGKAYLRNLGVSSLSPAAVQVASDLRAHLAKIQNPTTHAFVEEAIKCHEAQLYRSAVVMSWLAAVYVLHRVVVEHHLNGFNTEARRFNDKWKDAVNEDGLGRMGEAHFLDRLSAIGVIGKNQKTELQKALDLRNGCGHPNSLKVGPNVAAAHLELLLLNVFERFDT
jgi:hypothetical protein